MIFQGIRTSIAKKPYISLPCKHNVDQYQLVSQDPLSFHSAFKYIIYFQLKSNELTRIPRLFLICIYVCCIFSSALQTRFFVEANNMNPDQTAPFFEANNMNPDQTAPFWVHIVSWEQSLLGSSPFWVHIDCNI